MPENDPAPTTPGIGLALSGGGFRATLFHTGALWRLNELGLLPRLNEITSVSGGSILAAQLGLHWGELDFDAQGVAGNLETLVFDPIRRFCARTIDVGSIIGGILNPFSHPSELLIASYKKHLYGEATLQDLPHEGAGPRFTIYSTSMQTGASVRFAQPYLAEYHLGMYDEPTVALALAVAASSGFPPPYCPVTLKLDAAHWTRTDGADLHDESELRETLYLVDGGVYDNLGLERVWDRYESVFVSDAGAPFTVNKRLRLARVSQVARTKRTLDIMSEQTRALRVRRLIGDYEADLRRGAYWGIATKIDRYKLADKGLPGAITRDSARTAALARVRTRLNKFEPEEQGQLINWGYAVADAALRRYWLPSAEAPRGFPIAAYPV